MIVHFLPGESLPVSAGLFAAVVGGEPEMTHRRSTLFHISGGMGRFTGVRLTRYCLERSIPGIGKHIEHLIKIAVFLSILPLIINSVQHHRSETFLPPLTRRDPEEAEGV